MALSTPYTSNSSSPVATQNVGIKISQPGFNAQSASPTQLIFDSSWPSVNSAFTKYISAGSSGVVAHNLGFPPFTRAYQLDSSGNILSASIAAVNSTNVYFSQSPTGSDYFIDCSNIDLSTDVDYPSLPEVSVNSAYDPNFGIKIAKQGKSAVSKDPRDFVLHSRYRSPLIQAVKTQVTMASGNATIAVAHGAAGAIQYVNPAATAIWSYGYILSGGGGVGDIVVPAGAYAPAPYFSQAYPRTFTDGITSYLPWTASDSGATLVILRDPFFAPTVTQAFY